MGETHRCNAFLTRFWVDKRAGNRYTAPVMLKRTHRSQESQVRYWTRQAAELCVDIDEESLLPHLEPVAEAVNTMESDRRIVFFGGSGCGKSSLLSRVAGCPVMASAAWDTPHLCWRFRRPEHGADECSRYIPEENLEGLALIDTKPCDTPEMAKTVQTLLPGADVAVAVVDARRYEAAPVWDILDALPENSVGTIMVALTFTDSLSAEATLELAEAMRELTRKRLGRVLPVYAVNPASDAAVESFTLRVQEALSAPGGIRASIRTVLNAGVDLLYKEGSVLKSRENVARMDSGFLAGIEQEIDNFLSHQMLGLKPCVSQYTDAVPRTLPGLLRKMRWGFGWVLSPVTLLRLEVYGAGTERAFYNMVRSDIGRAQQESDSRFCISCSGHWRSVRPRMKQTLECEIGDFPETELAAELAQLRSRMERELHQPFRAEKFRSTLSESFKKRAGWMQAFIVVCCLLMSLGGLLGFLGQDMLGVGCLLLAALVWGAGSVVHTLAFSHLSHEVAESAKGIQRSLNQLLENTVENLIVSRVAAYRRLYTTPRRKVAEHEATLKPLQERHSRILRQLRGEAPYI